MFQLVYRYLCALQIKTKIIKHLGRVESLHRKICAFLRTLRPNNTILLGLIVTLPYFHYHFSRLWTYLFKLNRAIVDL